MVVLGMVALGIVILGLVILGLVQLPSRRLLPPSSNILYVVFLPGDFFHPLLLYVATLPGD
jgi:hypothetical protein